MKPSSVHSDGQSCAERLCLACGFCCNGVLFADVRLEGGDPVAAYRRAGLKLATWKSRRIGEASSGPHLKLPQPCPAFDGCRCGVYADRPGHCRQFECLLLQATLAGRVSETDALRRIRQARRQVRKVEGLLAQLGEADDDRPLRQRFQRLTRRLETAPLEAAAAAAYGDLTLAMHALNSLLAAEFYPGDLG